MCVHKAFCLRHIHHIQAAPIHHIQANAVGIYQLIYAWQKRKQNGMARLVLFRFICYINILCVVLKSVLARDDHCLRVPIAYQNS